MTATQMMPAVGQTAELVSEDLRVAVRILDAKVAYGQPRLLVAPITGSGQQWVSISRLRAQCALEVIR